ncbi:MAG TPA: hypothetical protein V6D00_06265, partial [Pantanalinema sp.]
MSRCASRKVSLLLAYLYPISALIVAFDPRLRAAFVSNIDSITINGKYFGTPRGARAWELWPIRLIGPAPCPSLWCFDVFTQSINFINIARP